MHAQGVGVPRKIEGGVERRVSGDKTGLRTIDLGFFSCPDTN